jgi:hypothetical protein
MAAATTASGYEIRFCGGDKIQWDGTPRFRASATSFPQGHTPANALQTVVERWNNSPADFRFNLTWNDGDVGLGNGQNEVWFTGDDDMLDGFPAVTFHWDDCGDFGFGDGNSEIEEKDVVFACDADWDCAADYLNPVPWYFGTNKNEMRGSGGGQRPFRTTAMHEFGHGLGLLHENDEYNIMGEDWTHIHINGDSATAYAGEDASDGAVRLYGPSAAAQEDVSVVGWRRCDPLLEAECEDRGEYSNHSRTRIFDANGVELADYQADAGQRIRVEFTFENNGSTLQPAVHVAFFLSRDTLISFGDRLLAEADLELARNDVYTRRQTIDLPGDLTSGDTYYVLAVVDPWNVIEEIYEDNSITYSRRFEIN